MNNETTMPGLLTMPGSLGPDARRGSRRFLLYKLIFVVALLTLGLGIWLY